MITITKETDINKLPVKFVDIVKECFDYRIATITNYSPERNGFIVYLEEGDNLDHNPSIGIDVTMMGIRFIGGWHEKATLAEIKMLDSEFIHVRYVDEYHKNHVMDYFINTSNMFSTNVNFLKSMAINRHEHNVT